MADVDPDTLLEWLQMGLGEERDMQLIALEQLCMLLLMSDNVDRCFEMCPPRSFLPALCKIFLDETAPDNVLEVTARAVTYYLDVSAECTRRIVAVDGAVKAICNRLVLVNPQDRTSKDLSEQCVKVLEFICTREPGAVFDAGGLTSTLIFICQCDTIIHKDTLHSAMSVVTRLCGKVEPTSETLPGSVQSLSALLHSEDPSVSDGALRCFATLADRFTRKSIDPAPLDAHGLTKELIKRLANCGSARAPVNNKPGAAGATPGSTPDQKHNFGITTIISLLITLCRGSPSITHELLRSDLPTAIEEAMKGDERCCLDTMRLADLILIVLFEGRDAIPKHGMAVGAGRNLAFHRFEGFGGERSHRQLIDCIRSKDTDTLIDAIDTGAFEVNFMDDVGQTLLNWASAFGTQEMVEFLCGHGADVNRGQRSSSLHYAACFGRPNVVKTLLRHGANATLRDEEGKTPLEKAKERNDEGHREVVKILESPEKYVTPETDKNKSKAEKPSKKKAEPKEQPVEKEKGDPEMSPIYLSKMLPIFISTYQRAVSTNVRKLSLALVRKMTLYSSPDHLKDVSKLNGVQEGFADVVSTALDQEDDEESHYSSLQIVKNLMDKSRDHFINCLSRDWVVNKIENIGECGKQENMEIGENFDEDATKKGAVGGQITTPTEEVNSQSKSGTIDDVPDSKTPSDSQKVEVKVLAEATSIAPKVVYNWQGKWTLVRGRDGMYLWSDSVAIELSNGSNGWFRYILNGKLSTMYSSGSPEGGADSSDSKVEFLDKLQRAHAEAVSSQEGLVLQPIFTKHGRPKIVVGNWSMCSNNQGELTISNIDGHQATILSESVSGFTFESNRGTKHNFEPDSKATVDFTTGVVSRPSSAQGSVKNKESDMKMKIRGLAKELYEAHFKTVNDTPRGVVTQLKALAEKINEANTAECANWQEQLSTSLQDLATLLTDDKTISPYEMYSSDMIQALLGCLVCKTANPEDSVTRIKLFHKHLLSGPNSSGKILIKKLVAVLESTERFPLYIYETPGSLSGGLHLLNRKLRFKLEKAPSGGSPLTPTTSSASIQNENEDNNKVADKSGLINYTGRSFRMEPLSTVEDLEKFLLKMVSESCEYLTKRIRDESDP
uniref:E3 ubiquitin-protein ligase HECTD1-like n=1 Tax=Styela clava TaxID=7725 RepID=UPI001939CD09|nr:E3 ubiquitin-protein ligase HECTD1-like [Styela clava]